MYSSSGQLPDFCTVCMFDLLLKVPTDTGLSGSTVKCIWIYMHGHTEPLVFLMCLCMNRSMFETFLQAVSAVAYRISISLWWAPFLYYNALHALLESSVSLWFSRDPYSCVTAKYNVKLGIPAWLSNSLRAKCFRVQKQNTNTVVQHGWTSLLVWTGWMKAVGGQQVRCKGATLRHRESEVGVMFKTKANMYLQSHTSLVDWMNETEWNWSWITGVLVAVAMRRSRRSRGPTPTTEDAYLL